MEEYTVYCTPAQTRKALELGAPIESEFEYQFLANQEHGYYRGGTFIELVECMGENTMVFGNEPNRAACIIPTAEQMIGWLEEQKIIHNINVIGNEYDCDFKYEINLNMPDGYDYLEKDGYHSRKEATLAAIDAALEYLENIKQQTL